MGWKLRAIFLACLVGCERIMSDVIIARNWLMCLTKNNASVAQNNYKRPEQKKNLTVKPQKFGAFCALICLCCFPFKTEIKLIEQTFQQLLASSSFDLTNLSSSTQLLLRKSSCMCINDESLR